MGTQLCFLCFCASLQITQMSCWSSWQKSFSFSLWTLQWSRGLEVVLLFFSCLKVSERFLRARLGGGLAIGNISLHTGHVWCLLCLHHSWRQCLQKLWPHSKRTGSLNISQHTGQVQSASDCDTLDAILSSLLCLVSSYPACEHSRRPNFTLDFTDSLVFVRDGLTAFR